MLDPAKIRLMSVLNEEIEEYLSAMRGGDDVEADFAILTRSSSDE
jgi:hypothetical protein